MNLKRIIIAITVVLIGTGNINAQDMKTEVPKISDFPMGKRILATHSISQVNPGWHL